MAGWNADNAAGPVGQGAVTLVEGSAFCISLQSGDIFPAGGAYHPGHGHGCLQSGQLAQRLRVAAR